ncbi:MAG: mevalonate kinase, partial [Anaerolineaceae bacterium]|nr:mevalonate kinase [Anaerolineaceae bacterium]
SAFLGHPLSDELVSELAYEIEKLYHLTPSGIDNTVITYARPIYFRRGHPVEFLDAAEPFTLVIADSGLKSLTREVVASVRQGWESDPKGYEARFEAITSITNTARQLMEQRGSLAHLGELLNENHNRLQALGVSCPELDQLVSAARKAGALGAKLSGAGRGGNMIALVSPDQATLVAAALKEAGAARTLITTVDSRLHRE